MRSEQQADDVEVQPWKLAAKAAFASLGEPLLTFDLGLEAFTKPEVWGHDARATPEDLAHKVGEILKSNAHVAVGPWGMARPDARVRPEIEWIRHIPDWNAHHLGALVPVSMLSGRAVDQLWKALPPFVTPSFVIDGTQWLPSIHKHFRIALIILSPTQSPLRFFHIPADQPTNLWMRDLERLCRMGGGSSDFGYVVRDGVPTGAPLTFEAHDPEALAQAADLTAFGDSSELREVFSCLMSRRQISSKINADQASTPEIRGRDIRPDGSLQPTIPDFITVDEASAVSLQAGDIVVASLSPPSSPVFRCGVVREEHLPAIAGTTVVVLRPKETMQEGTTQFFLQFFRAPAARQVHAAANGHLAQMLTPSNLSAMPIPRPDPPLVAALDELISASETLAKWRDQASSVIQGIFNNPSAAEARQDVIKNGQQVRMRAELGGRLDDFYQTVRTQYPFPVAYRWRSLTSLMSGPDRQSSYALVLETYEVLLCYLAQVALKMADTADITLSARDQLASKLRSGRSGLGMGDWVMILEEVAGRQFKTLSATTPLGEVRSFLSPGGAAYDARLRLSRRRNDAAHLRSVPVHELPNSLASAFNDLRTLLDSASFLMDLPLVHVVENQWDSLRARGALRTRRLMGDHSIVPFTTSESQRSDLEAGSLYIADAQGVLHLMRPLLIGRECPACQTWSTFHIEAATPDRVQLKSLEHGHAIEDRDMPQTLVALGLI